MDNMFSALDISTDFSRMVDEDIQKCDLFERESHNYQEKRQFFIELISKYSAHIAGFGDGLEGYRPSSSQYLTNYQADYELENNIRAIKFKLIAFKNNGYKNTKSMDDNPHFNVNNTLTANQTQNITISFEEVKQKVKEMTGLSDEETENVLAKIHEIKAIVDQKESKKTKWKKIKPILIWLADKSVDVGCALLPLILKIGEQA